MFYAQIVVGGCLVMGHAAWWDDGYLLSVLCTVWFDGDGVVDGGITLLIPRTIEGVSMCMQCLLQIIVV